MKRNERFGSEADIPGGLRDVRFTPKSGHWLSACDALRNKGQPKCDLDYSVHGFAQIRTILIAPPGGVQAADRLLPNSSIDGKGTRLPDVKQ